MFILSPGIYATIDSGVYSKVLLTLTSFALSQTPAIRVCTHTSSLIAWKIGYGLFFFLGSTMKGSAPNCRSNLIHISQSTSACLYFLLYPRPSTSKSQPCCFLLRQMTRGGIKQFMYSNWLRSSGALFGLAPAWSRIQTTLYRPSEQANCRGDTFLTVLL